MLARLYILPVTTRIQFKVALLTFMTLTTHQPSYVHSLLQPHCSSRQLRSASHNLLEIARMRTGFAQRSFTYCAPHMWNSLPHNLNITVDTFKKKLKTFYYRAMLCIRGTSHGPVSVSVCLSQVGVLLKRLNGGSHKQHSTILPKTLVFLCQRSPRNSTGVTSYEGAECRWGGSKSATFD